MSEPDLFVVCKNCSSEVSPYVTECPYCGQRVRKRAPKIDRSAPEEVATRRRVRPPSLPRLRRGEIPGIAPETRPTATIAVVALSLLAAVALSTREVTSADIGVLGPVDGEWWRLVTTAFPHENLGYQFVTLVVIAIFGTHLERRSGSVSLLVVFVLSTAAGAALSVATDIYPAIGANGSALGILCAWLVDDRRAAGRGEDRETDLTGVYVIAALLAALPLATEWASVAAGLGGAVTGTVLGLALTALRR